MVKNPIANAGDMRPRFHPWVGKISWRKTWWPTPVFLSGESHGQRSLEADYSPRGHRVRRNWNKFACPYGSLLPQKQVSPTIDLKLLGEQLWLSKLVLFCHIESQLHQKSRFDILTIVCVSLGVSLQCLCYFTYFLFLLFTLKISSHQLKKKYDHISDQTLLEK